MNNWWRELKINSFVLYLGKQKVNERKIMKSRENTYTIKSYVIDPVVC